MLFVPFQRKTAQESGLLAFSCHQGSRHVEAIRKDLLLRKNLVEKVRYS